MIARKSPLKRSPAPARNVRPKAKRTGNPRRGRVVDKARLEWAATQPCQITGEFPATTHHVRFCGSPKDDTRIIRLAARLHMKTAATPGVPCIEDGKAVFEKFHGVSIEHLIEGLKGQYECA